MTNLVTILAHSIFLKHLLCAMRNIKYTCEQYKHISLPHGTYSPVEHRNIRHVLLIKFDVCSDKENQ
jgi:hypothetical protein